MRRLMENVWVHGSDVKWSDGEGKGPYLMDAAGNDGIKAEAKNTSFRGREMGNRGMKVAIPLR